MRPSSKAQAYVQQVCEQIRWQKAHGAVQEELLAHIEDQREAFLRAGASAEEAEILAVEEMGSAVETGSRFDRLYRPRIAWQVLFAAGAVVCVGNLLYAGILLAMGAQLHPLRDLWGLPVGLLAMAVGYWLDYSVLLQKCMDVLKIIARGDGQAFRLLVVAGGLLALLRLLLHAEGTIVMNGARYVVAGSGAWSISYVALFFPLLFCAFQYSQRGNGWKGFLYSFLFLGLGSFLLYTYTSDLLLMLIVGAVLLCYGLRKNWFGCSKWWACSFLLYPLCLLAFVFSKPYRIKRLAGILQPFADPQGAGYGAVQVLQTLREASLFGAGSGDLLAAHLDYLTPNEHLLTLAVSHWGWWILLPVLLLYGALLWLCYAACRKVKSQLGNYVVLTITSSWMVQIFFYCCNNFSSVQTSTYPLLFVQGNAAMICNLFLLGLLLSVYKTGALQQDWALSLSPEQAAKRQQQDLIRRLQLTYQTEEEVLAAWRGEHEDLS